MASEDPFDLRPFLKCMWCEASATHFNQTLLVCEATLRGWHDINRVEPDGGEGKPDEFQGTCPDCIWHQAAANHQAVS